MRLEAYATLLRQWQRGVNLVAASTLDDVWHRHFADSAQIAGLAPEARIWLDLGSGAGFPGLVIAILLADREGVRVHLVESNARKCAFLAEVARVTAAPVEIHAARIETLAAAGTVTRPEAITARALARLETLLDHAHPFFASETRALLLKGRQVDREVAEARRKWRFGVQLIASRTDADGRIAVVTELAPIGPSGPGAVS